MTQKIITTILGLIIIGGLAWYINKTYLKTESNEQESTRPVASGSLDIKDAKQITGKIVYLTIDNARNIWQWESGTNKKIYTDADEKEKILQLSNLSHETGEVLAIVSENSDKSASFLTILNLKSAKKQVVEEKFPLTSSIAFSDNGQKIAYTTFSNLEDNYGYTLYAVDRDGSNKKKLTNHTGEIRSLAWNPTASKIAFSTTAEKSSELNQVEISTFKEAKITSFEGKIIDWISWQDSQKLLIGLHRLNTETSSEIYTINVSGENLQKIKDIEGGIANFIWQDPASDNFSYLVGQYQNSLNDKTAGQIYIEDQNLKTTTPIIKGNQILGYL